MPGHEGGREAVVGVVDDTVVGVVVGVVAFVVVVNAVVVLVVVGDGVVVLVVVVGGTVVVVVVVVANLVVVVVGLGVVVNFTRVSNGRRLLEVVVWGCVGGARIPLVLQRLDESAETRKMF